MTNESERKIVKKIVARDETALYKFYKSYKKPLLNFILRFLKDKQDAEEVLQDSFVGFIESLRNFRYQSSLKTFLFSIAKNKIVDKQRKKKIKKILFSYMPENIVESLARVFMDQEIDRKVLEKKIETIFTRLPNDYSYVLRLKYKEGLKVVEIAEKIKLSFKATESLIFRARKAFIVAYSAYERQDLPKFTKKTGRYIFGVSQ